MAISMTGYGSETMTRPDWTVTWEIRSVNHRYLDIKWRVPHTLYFLQQKWEKIIRAHALRGRLDVNLHLRINNPEILGIGFDQAMAGAMLTQLEDFARSSGNDFAPDLNLFLRNSSLWVEEKSGINPEMEEDLALSLKTALKHWNESRQTEGQNMLNDIVSRLESLVSLLAHMESFVADNTSNRFNDLKDKLSRIMNDLNIEADENRFLQELIIMTDRLDVSEEITRLKTHLKAMRQLTDQHSEIGRKLDFMLQEAFREINTCANKCQNTDISRVAVDFKAELEKCREQAQNLE